MILLFGCFCALNALFFVECFSLFFLFFVSHFFDSSCFFVEGLILAQDERWRRA